MALVGPHATTLLSPSGGTTTFETKSGEQVQDPVSRWRIWQTTTESSEKAAGSSKQLPDPTRSDLSSGEAPRG